MTRKYAESYSFWRNHLESCHALARPQHHLSLPGCSFPSKAGRELTCFTGIRLNVLYLLLKKTAVKVWGYLLVWQMLLAFPFWRVMSSLFLHYTNHWRGFVSHMTKHLVLIVDFCQVCLLTSLVLSLHVQLSYSVILRPCFLFLSLSLSSFLLAVCSIQPFQSESSQSLRKGSLCRALSPGFLVEQLRYCPLFWGDAGVCDMQQK